jgi:hypothetical protein
MPHGHLIKFDPILILATRITKSQSKLLKQFYQKLLKTCKPAGADKMK